MPDSLLDLLKLVLLVLLYLFFGRVLWAVWSEVRNPATLRNNPDPTPAATPFPASAAPTPAMGERRELRPVKGRGELPARLTIIEPKERRGTAYAINSTLSVGRDPDNTIHIDDAYLSGHHARVSMTDSGVVVHDLTSRNGTFLNGTRLTEPRPVRIGDRIQIGYTVFEAQ